MPPRIIVHLDADAFFASVEQAADPRLRGKPIAVGGEKRGIIASASYEARRFGVYTPMPTVRARKLCPKLIVLPGDFAKYEQFSRWMFSYAYEFTPTVEIGSIDEGYFDLSASREAPVEAAETIRQAIRQSLKITVSEGLGSSKLVSQIASKLHKPAAFLNVPSGKEIPFLHPLPNHWLPGVGPKTSQRLLAGGLARIGQIAVTPTELLSLLVGRAAPQLKHFANGIDERPVVPVSEPARSYSCQETFAEDQTDEAWIEAVLHRMADQLMAKVREDRKSIRTVTLKVRYNDMAEDQCGESLLEPTDLEADIYGRLHALLQRAWRRRVSLRLVSLKFSNVYDDYFRVELPLETAARQREARRRLAATVDELRRTHGDRVVFRGHDFILEAAAQKPPPGASATGQPTGTESTRPGTTRGLRNGSGHAVPAVLREELRAHRLVWKKPSAETYLPLHVRSFYSFLDSTLSVEAIVAWAREQQLPAVALADAGNLHGAVPFVQAAQAAGIKPVLGAEITVEHVPLQLYVENAAGYRNLCRILTRWPNGPGPATTSDRTAPLEADEPETEEKAWRTRARKEPGSKMSWREAGRILAEWAEGLIAVSPDTRLAAFFRDRFYQAVSDPAELQRGAGESRFPKVSSLPARYAQPADRWKYDVVQSIRTLTLLRQAHPEKRLDGAFHLRAMPEMAGLCRAHPELLARTAEIAARCAFAFPFGQPQFPAFVPPDASRPRDYLRRLVLAGVRKRYPGRFARMIPQVEQELSMIGEVGYDEYFLVVWDILQECRRRGIDWITRGSAADSLVCYCLGISDVCPVRFDLYFRRFLNKERMSLHKLPDIDVDFAHDRKDDVVDLIFEKYGRGHTAVVGGFSTYHARSALGDVAKVLGVSEYQIRRVTERLPFAHAHHLEQAVAASRECADLPLAEEPYRSALQMAQFLSNFPRYPKMHPCGLVLSRQPMLELVPTFLSQKGYPTTHFDMEAVEALGLVKMDILAQGGLAAMRDVKAMLVEQGNAGAASRLPQRWPRPGAPAPGRAGEIDLHGLEPWEDPRVWEMIASGGARAVHHIESPAMVGLCRMCNVRDIDTLVAIVSVIRPGAANESKKMEFARRYQGLAPVRYPHSSLEPCLRSTFGLVVYEEHILQMCEAFAGLPSGRADVLRRALGKEKTDVIAQIAGEFAASARARGRTEQEIREVWDLVTGFRGYAFCKAHSTAYGVEAYEAAWLKCYYPAEFMAAVLTNGKGFYSPLVYRLECHRLGISFLPPCINQPGPAFVPHHPPDAPPAIRVPSTRVQGLTERTKDRLLEEHRRGEFDSLRDFYRRVLPSPEELESLIRVGAFDCFGRSRTAQFWEGQWLQRVYGSASEPGQGWLLPPPGTERLPEISLQEPTRQQGLAWETELLDFTVSGHPLELHEDIAWETYCPVASLGQYIGKEVVTCGLVIEQRIHHQVTGEPMKFLTLADWTGLVETELFAPTYRSYGLATVRYPVLEVTATVEPFENGRGFSLRVHKAGKPRTRKLGTGD